MKAVVLAAAAACSSTHPGGGAAGSSAGTAPAAITDARGAVVAAGRRVTLAGRLDRSVCAVTSDDRLRCWGDRKASPVEIADAPKHIVQLAGQRAVTADGRVWRWSDGSWTDTGASGVRAIAEDPQFDVRYALETDGTVRAQGDRTHLPTAPAGDDDADAPIAGLTGVVEIAAGDWQVGISDWHPYGCARDRADHVRCWEADLVPHEVPGAFTQIVAAGTDSICALRDTRKVWCWWRFSREHRPGSQESLELPELAGSVELAGQAEAGRGYLATAGGVCGIDGGGAVRCVALRSDLMGASAPAGAVRVAAPPVAHVAFAGDVGLVVLRDGGLMAWGQNDRGQVGDGTLIDRAAPVAVVHLLDDVLPPAETGAGKEQQSDVAMDWSGLPAACARPATVGDVAVVSAYAYDDGQELRLWMADYRLDPLHPGADPRGQQKVARLVIQRFAAGWQPLPIDRATYRAADSALGRTFGGAVSTGADPETFHPAPLVHDGDRLQLAVADGAWVCGTLIAGRSATPIAARVLHDAQ